MAAATTAAPPAKRQKRDRHEARVAAFPPVPSSGWQLWRGGGADTVCTVDDDDVGAGSGREAVGNGATLVPALSRSSLGVTPLAGRLPGVPSDDECSSDAAAATAAAAPLGAPAPAEGEGDAAACPEEAPHSHTVTAGVGQWTVLGAETPRGLCLARRFCVDHASVYDALESAEAGGLRWTGLKPDNRSMKTYTGTVGGLRMRGDRYKKVWGRRKPERMGLLTCCPALTAARDAVCELVRQLPGAAGCELLTEQLIRYAQDDLFFNLHWDIDAEDPSAPLSTLGSIEPSEFGPGAVIATLNLGCRCHVLLGPRAGAGAGAGVGRRSVPLEPGDLYVLMGDARWRWLHGVSVPDAELVARRAVVWRFQVP